MARRLTRRKMQAPRDTITAQYEDKDAPSLLLKLRGPDRPGVIGSVTTALERNNLYVAKIDFSTGVGEKGQANYNMKIDARGGSRANFQEVARMVEAGEMGEQLGAEKDSRIHLRGSYVFHIDVYTPDLPFLTASVASRVSMKRKSGGKTERGSIVSLYGITHNSEGPQGGTAYFALRASIATRECDVSEQIIADLQKWAQSTIEAVGGTLLILVPPPKRR